MESDSGKKVKEHTFSLEEENQTLRNTVNFFKAELDRLRHPPLVVCDVLGLYGDKAVIRLSNNTKFLVNISDSALHRIKVGDKALAEQKSLNIIDKLAGYKRISVENHIVMERPGITWDDIGGLKDQIKELKEVIELPLKKPQLFKKIGIQPPKGVLLHGPTGTGKTQLAKAVATSTNSTFIHVVGSELVQKFIGEGAKFVKDIFRLAREKAPSIIFIDEVDAIASERMDVGTSGDREVQRTLMQLLSEIDGFNNLGDVKIICATNRIDILDTSILRPGRLDRLIEVPFPDKSGIRDILKVHTKNMNIVDVDLDKVVDLCEGFSGAEIKAVCVESGYYAIRNKRPYVIDQDFVSAINKLSKDSKNDYINMFG